MKVTPQGVWKPVLGRRVGKSRIVRMEVPPQGVWKHDQTLVVRTQGLAVRVEVTPQSVRKRC